VGVDGTFKQVDSQRSIALSRFKSEATLSVIALPAIPIQYAEHDIIGYLTRRGRMYYKFRNKGLVAYTGSVVGSDTYLVSRQSHYLLLKLTEIAASEMVHDRHFHVQAESLRCN
jgi:hypothetical protein